MLSRQFAKIALLFLIMGFAPFGHGKSLKQSSANKATMKMAGRKANRKQKCSENIARTTIYYTPDVKELCNGSSSPCSKFRSEVELQGSGRLTNDKILTSTGKVRNIGDCDLTIGAGGTCLTPYISIAADPSEFSMGDIIFIEALRGKTYEDENSEKVTHRGYLMVEDIGGKIKGGKRFDIYVGKNTELSEDFDAFKINDTTTCSKEKEFKIIRKWSWEYRNALDEIKKQTGNTEQNISVKSATNWKATQ
ncbi:MAG: 3D domain-containing protein [Bdellovibrio sp.]